MDISTLKDKIKIVFFDIDDTLYRKNGDFLPASITPALKQLQANGVQVAIATGRTPSAFPDKIKQLIQDVGIKAFVTLNGQHNFYDNEIIKQYPIPTERIQQLVNFFKQNNIDYSFVTPDITTVSAKTAYIAEALDPVTTNYIVDTDYFKRHQVLQMLIYYGEEKDDFIRESGILGDSLKTIRWHPNSVDIFAKDGSKARGIQHILDRLNLTAEQAMVFGDGLNDIEMFNYAGVSVAMGNAMDEVKSVADFVAGTVEQNGIAEFLRKAGLI